MKTAIQLATDHVEYYHHAKVQRDDKKAKIHISIRRRLSRSGLFSPKPALGTLERFFLDISSFGICRGVNEPIY